MRRICGIATAVAAIALAAVAATASRATAARPSCPPTTTLLPDLGHGSEALAIHGDTVVGDVVTGTGEAVPAYWRDGELVLIDGVESGWAGDINADGEIVGNGNAFAAPFAVVDGSTHLLPIPGGFAYARRINASGQIAGAVGAYAARWDSYASQPVSLLPAAGDSFSFAKGINDAGQVAGDTDAPTGVPRSAMWDMAGEIRVLPSGFGAGQPSDLFAINNLGVSAGESFIGDELGPTADQATRWSGNGVPTLIPLLPGTNASAGLELNDLGWVVGVAVVDLDFATGTDAGGHAFVWLGSGPAKTLPVPGYSYADSESNAHDVTDDGIAVGRSGPVGGPYTATVWTCVRAQAYVPNGALVSSSHRLTRHTVPVRWSRPNPAP